MRNAVWWICLALWGCRDGEVYVSATDVPDPDPLLWRFVSIPDWTNNDVAYRDPRWTGVDPDGSVGLLDYALDTIAAEAPTFVLIAGDLVNGKWGLGDDDLDAREAEARRMADRFLGGTLMEFGDRNLPVFAVVGDHELGDNPWPDSKLELVPTYKANFVRHLQPPDDGPPELPTAYTFEMRDVAFFIVDEFDVHEDHMRIGVTGAQLQWLVTMMDDSDARFKFVVGHVPILPGFRQRSSSGLQVTDGPDSDLWQALVDAGVDAYLCGEVHDMSFQQRDGVLQLITGTQPSNVPEFNYLVVDAHRSYLSLRLMSIETTLTGPRDATLDPLGQDKYTERRVRVSPEQQAAGFEEVGSMRIGKHDDRAAFEARVGYFQTRWEDQ